MVPQLFGQESWFTDDSCRYTGDSYKNPPFFQRVCYGEDIRKYRKGGLTMLAWFIAGGSTAAFLALWFYIVYRELSRKRHSVACAARQLGFGQDTLKQARAAPEADYLQAMRDTDRRIYEQAAREYNAARLLFVHRFPGWVMGFQAVSERAQDAQIPENTQIFKEEEL